MASFNRLQGLPPIPMDDLGTTFSFIPNPSRTGLETETSSSRFRLTLMSDHII